MLEESVPSIESPPFVVVDGVHNFRDIGGYVCQPPAAALSSMQSVDETAVFSWCVRPGFIFRSAQPSQITTTGVETITKNLNIQAIFDLRSKEEVQRVKFRYPDSILDIPGTTRFAVPVFEEGQHSPLSLAEKYGTEGGFVKAYEDIARQAARTGSYRTVMKHLLHNQDCPLLFHCTAGKDRTGVFAALVLKLCGVADEDIVNDYALTTHGLGVWREHLIQTLMTRGDASSREQAEAIVASRKEDMRVFLNDVVEVKFGGSRKYFIDICGLKEVELDQIIMTLVIPEKIEG